MDLTYDYKGHAMGAPRGQPQISMREPVYGASADPYRGAFSAFNRVLTLCTPDVQYGRVEEVSAFGAASRAPKDKKDKVNHNKVQTGRMAGVLKPVAASKVESMTLADLADGPYYVIAMQLGADSLCAVDRACRLTRELNRRHGGPWCTLGRQAFHGLELDGDSLFEPEMSPSVWPAGDGRLKMSRKFARVDWKGRYMRFKDEVKMFRSPFSGSEITAVDQADEIAYCRCKLRTDLLLDPKTTRGVYLEVVVHTNPDNVSLAVVDFEGGGCSSVTFSPDTGAVIRERKVREAPRKVEGTYIQPLMTITSGQGFEGSMGLYLCGGHLAFYRRHAAAPSGDGQKEAEVGAWETTGFVTDLSWAEGRRLTPCLAFRDVGNYHVRLTCVGAAPPLATQKTAAAYDDANWRSLDWDAGEQEALEE